MPAKPSKKVSNPGVNKSSKTPPKKQVWRRKYPNERRPNKAELDPDNPAPYGTHADGTPKKQPGRKQGKTIKEIGLKVCGAKKVKSTERCGLQAGFGTDHPGFGNCKYHGGSFPSNKVSATREMVQERMRKDAKMYGAAIDIGPHEALLLEVQRTAGHVEWLRDKIANMQSEDNLVQYSQKDGMKPEAWHTMYLEERKHLVATCSTAIKCGIAERQIRLAEAQGQMIAAMFVKFINDDSMEFTPKQRIIGPKVFRQLLLELPMSGVTPDLVTGANMPDLAPTTKNPAPPSKPDFIDV